MKLVQLGVLHKEVQKDLVKYLVRALARVRALSSNTNENEENGQSEEQTENAAEKDTDAQPSSDDINKTRKEIASILIHLKNAAVRIICYTYLSVVLMIDKHSPEKRNTAKETKSGATSSTNPIFAYWVCNPGSIVRLSSRAGEFRNHIFHRVRFQ